MNVQTQSDYYILRADTSERLQALVEQHLRLGWRLAGGVSINRESSSVPARIWCQAVYKENTPQG